MPQKQQNTEIMYIAEYGIVWCGSDKYSLIFGGVSGVGW